MCDYGLIFITCKFNNITLWLPQFVCYLSMLKSPIYSFTLQPIDLAASVILLYSPNSVWSKLNRFTGLDFFFIFNTDCLDKTILDLSLL